MAKLAHPCGFVRFRAEAVVLRPMPYANPAPLVLLLDSSVPEDGGFLCKDFVAIKSQSRTHLNTSQLIIVTVVSPGSRSLAEENLNQYKVPL